MTLRTHVLAAATALATLLGAGSAAAQDFTFGWNPRTGDVWVDTWLSDMNHYGSRYRQPFIDEMVRYHGAPRDLVTDLLLERHWAPGDIYYACALAQVIGRPCRYVVDEWDRSHGEGWGAVAKRLGIKPGSAEFHRLKRGFVPTYDRWARPIVIDQDLFGDFPNRAVKTHGAPGKGPAKAVQGRGHGKPDKGGKGRGNGHGNGGKGKGNGKG